MHVQSDESVEGYANSVDFMQIKCFATSNVYINAQSDLECGISKAVQYPGLRYALCNNESFRGQEPGAAGTTSCQNKNYHAIVRIHHE